MPKGVDFLCVNKDCKYHGNRITMHGPWPVKPISEVEDQEVLSFLRSSGRTNALFVFPNDSGKTPSGYRAQAYCEFETAIFDMEYGTLQEASSAKDVACGSCGKTMRSMTECVEFGVKCPSCGEKMNPMHWFTKA